MPAFIEHEDQERGGGRREAGSAPEHVNHVIKSW